MSKEPVTPEKIEANKQRSIEKFQVRKEAQAKVAAELAAIRSFLHENKVSFMMDESTGLSVTLGVISENTKDNKAYRFAFSICSKNDENNFKIAKKLIGERLMSKDDRFSFVIGHPSGGKDIPIKSVLVIGYKWLQMGALAGGPDTSQDFRNTVKYDETESFDMSRDFVIV